MSSGETFYNTQSMKIPFVYQVYQED